ncbi:sensor histidine kinase [Actinoallomurus bryophytorum]|uniref:histidine kinase n=1 Tax=Actinoallomurus bryophytorum TaxID=1490222 RepID=A0A543CUG2_9ACTN|nr:sensor histidine kinase [Actinoallomurus bryophytorum]TQM00679.1 signal transduction histidine kinase [Actinoallomurus bryophytorum]
MPTNDADPPGPERAGRWGVRTRGRALLNALEHLVGGLGTGILALAALLWLVLVALTCLVGVGLLLAPTVPRVLHVVAERERARLSRWGPEIIGPEPVPAAGVRAALADQAVRRDLGWVAVHGTFGLLISLAGLSLPVNAVQDVTFPLWWRMLSPGGDKPNLVFWSVHDLSSALEVALLGLVLGVLFVLFGPALARLQAWPGRRLLVPHPDTDLSLRVAQLSATRAAALDAHATELRRIERSLHDGAQNRLVAVTVLLGATRRALARDPADADAMLERAHDAAELALAELRTVVRGILPPVLADRGLAGALAGLASNCGVPCEVDVDVPGRCAASVEATTYFVVAETLTNVAKHSGARHATVTVRRQGDRLFLQVVDDGHGGADEHHGSGITGIRRRIEAHDGHLTLTSPPGGPTTLQAELPCGS